MWFSININAQGYAIGALHHNLFSPTLDPSDQWLLHVSLNTDYMFYIPGPAEAHVKNETTFINYRNICILIH